MTPYSFLDYTAWNRNHCKIAYGVLRFTRTDSQQLPGKFQHHDFNYHNRLVLVRSLKYLGTYYVLEE